MYNAAALYGGWDVKQDGGGPNGLKSADTQPMRRLRMQMELMGVPNVVFDAAVIDAFAMDNLLAQGLPGAARDVPAKRGFTGTQLKAYRKLVKRVRDFVRSGGLSGKQRRVLAAARKDHRKLIRERLLDPATTWWGSQRYSFDTGEIEDPTYNLISSGWAGAANPPASKKGIRGLSYLTQLPTASSFQAQAPVAPAPQV